MTKQVSKIIAMAVLAIGGSSVMAETVNFSGTVATSCAFSNAAAGGMIAQVVNNEYVLGSGLTYAGLTPGTPATVDIAYDGAPTFSINAVSTLTTPNGAPAVTSIHTGVWFTSGTKSADNTAAAATAGANNFTAGSKSFLLDAGATTDTAVIGMYATAASPWVTGNYSASTTITCQ